jgi:hypothetical protein
MVGPMLLVAAVALAVVALVAWPLLRDRPDTATGVAGDLGGQELQDEIDRALRAIREIEFDHAAGNLSDTDFAELDAVERARAADLLRRRERAQADRHP